jgi:hypothetical protein
MDPSTHLCSSVDILTDIQCSVARNDACLQEINAKIEEQTRWLIRITETYDKRIRDTELEIANQKGSNRIKDMMYIGLGGVVASIVTSYLQR